MSLNRNLQTIAAANGIGTDSNFGAVTPPLYLTTTFTFAGYEQARAYDYTRAGNPSRALLADTIAQLEGGAGATITASGMAAIDLVLGTLGRDDLIVAPHDCYGGTYRLIAARAAKGQFNVAFVDQSDEAALAAALRGGPALVLIETPSNPLMRVVDIRAVSTRAKEIGRAHV